VEVAIVLLAVTLSLGTAVVATIPTIGPALINDRLDITIVTGATLVSGAVAALDWQRGRVAHDPAALLRSSAFAVLALLNSLTLLAGLVGADAALGATLDAPGQLPLIAGIIGRGVAAALLVFAGWVALGRGVPALGPKTLLVGPAGVVLLLLVVATLLQGSLPLIAPTAVLETLADDPTAPLVSGAAPALLLIQTIIGVAFLGAALLAHADLLRLGFYALLLIGVVAESRDDLADLRAATMEVRRLATAESAAAALEERARLAREIHDGLAQDLWYAKLKQSRLAQIAGFSGEASQLNEEVGDAIDNALTEARDAVAAMRRGAESGPLLDILVRHVDDFADRFALRAELTSDGPLPEIGPRAQAEVLRIVQEALTNVRKHADATVVRVDVTTDGDLRFAVTDNGRGFRAESVPPGFGLESMRQRAAVIGARLTVSSQPQNGTRIELSMPINRRKETDGA